MKFSDDLFKKVEKKTKIDKDTIISLAQMVEANGLKDEKTLREVINKLSINFFIKKPPFWNQLFPKERFLYKIINLMKQH